MSFYLKKTKLKGRTYLSIDESFYSHEKKGTAHKVYRSLGSLETLKAQGMSDPVAHFQKEVDKLNAKQRKQPKLITQESPNRYLGYFPLKAILEKLKVKKYIDLFQLQTDFDFDLFNLLSSLIYARAVQPCSKHRTFHEVLPQLYEKRDYSYDQLLTGLAFLGNVYEKIIEIFTVQTKARYGLDSSKTYFDCTNFYFEIDREDDLRRKGPSKENRKDPIVGLGLLLDKNQIPLGMQLYPGNESEKPVLRDIIDRLKKQNSIKGRTIHVADKGINCAQNIYFSKKNHDGYIFSKSVKQLPEIEREWLLHEDGYEVYYDREGKLMYRLKAAVDEFPYSFEHLGKKVTVRIKEKRVVSYNPSLAQKQQREIRRLEEKAKSMCYSQAKRAEFGVAAKYVVFTDEKGEKAHSHINQNAVQRDLELAGYNLLVTSEIQMPAKDIYSTYHNLWRIEESFRIMKSDLDARPVFLQKEDTIKGHFLLCYLTVLLERIFQFKILQENYSSSEIFAFIRTFKVTKCERKYVNQSTDSPLIRELAVMTDKPILNYFLSEAQVKSILNTRF